MRQQADAAKKLLTIPDGDHLTLLNVWNSWQQSKYHVQRFCNIRLYHISLGGQDKNWAWENFLAARALQQADNVRAQLQRNMERFEIDLLSLSDSEKLYKAVRQALVCGFFMQVAHKEGEKGNYVTVKDHQVCFVDGLFPPGVIVDNAHTCRWLRSTPLVGWRHLQNGSSSMNLF
jgi:pre-mRNA-splicing factor ATP-dependent RNA helicase DHX15/PRP43